MHLFERVCRCLRLAGLIERQRKVQLRGNIPGLKFQRVTILYDRVLVARDTRIGRPEIGERKQRIRPLREILPVSLNGAGDVSGLVQTDGLLQNLFRGIGLSAGAGAADQ